MGNEGNGSLTPDRMCFTLVRLTACRVGQSGIISDKDGLRLPWSPGFSLGERSCHGDESECVCVEGER